jgi:coenzyme PQQ precursor peptide PqqA
MLNRGADAVAGRSCPLARRARWPYVRPWREPRAKPFWEDRMSWKTPKIVEVQVGMEINMYACASRK